MDELEKHKQEEEKTTNRLIEDALEAINKDPKKSASIVQIVKETSLHRNTVSQRIWELTHPLTLGKKFFPAGQTIHIDILRDAIKEDRASKAARRTKKQLEQAETLTDEKADLNEHLAAMQEDNSQLFLEMEEMREAQKLAKRVWELREKALQSDLDLAEKRTSNHLKSLSKMREERDQWKSKADELEKELQKLKPNTSKKASLAALKPQTNGA